MTLRIAVVGLAIAACTGAEPTPTGTVCPTPDPMTLAYSVATVPACTGSFDDGDCGFGSRFVAAYCNDCHSSQLKRPQRNGAPIYHDFDTLIGVLQVANHIDEQAGKGPKADNHFMPPERCPSEPGGPLDRDCPQPTAEEREKLAQWIACESTRDHGF